MLNPDHYEEFYALLRLIKYSRGFSIGYAVCNGVPLRQELVAELKPLLDKAEINLLEVNLSERVENLRKEITAQLDIPDKAVIFVYGFEKSLDLEAKPGKALSTLNMERELFSKEFPCPVILWLPSFALERIQKFAPDFFAWRSGAYEFKEEDKKVQQAAQMAIYDDYVGKLSLAQKQEKIDILKNLLVEYRNLGDEKREKEITRDILRKLGNIYFVIGELKKAEGCYQDGLSLSQELKDQKNIAGILHNLGMIHHRQGDYEQALEKYNRSLNISEKLGDKSGIAITLHQLGMIHHDQGDHEQAIEKYNQSLKIKEELGDKSGIANTIHQLGMIHHQHGDYEQAIEKYNQSQKIFKELRDKSGIALTLHQLGMIYHQQGDYEQALEKYNQSLKIKEEQGDKSGIAITLGQLGRLAEDQGDYCQAVKNYNAALTLFRYLNSPYAKQAEEYLARASAKLSDTEKKTCAKAG